MSTLYQLDSCLDVFDRLLWFALEQEWFNSNRGVGQLVDIQQRLESLAQVVSTSAKHFEELIDNIKKEF